MVALMFSDGSHIYTYIYIVVDYHYMMWFI